MDPAIWAALIGSVAVVVAAVIPMVVAHLRQDSPPADPPPGPPASTVKELSELSQRFRDLATYVGTHEVYATREVLNGTYGWWGVAPRFAEFKGVSVDGLCDVVSTTLGSAHPTVIRMRAAVRRVREELERVEERWVKNESGEARIDFFTSDERGRLVLSHDLGEVAAEIEVLLGAKT